MNASVLAAGLAWAVVAPGALGQDADPLPSLDELLGLEDAEADEAGAADGQRVRELERKLTAREAAQALEQAVQLMDDATAEIAGRGAGLTAQRLQEDILLKLDQVIASAEQNQGGGGSSSSGSSSQSQQQSQPGKQQSGGQASGSSPESSEAAMPPGGTEASLRPSSLPDAASWGALPERLRGALEQGSGDTFSSAYRRLTEAYYRKLAERAQEER